MSCTESPGYALKTQWLGSCFPIHRARTSSGVLCHRRWWRANNMWKERIESERGFVCEVLEILLDRTILDGEKAQVVVLKGHKMGEMQRPSIRRFMSLLSYQGRPEQLQEKAFHT